MSVSARIAGIEIDRQEVRVAVVKTGGRTPAVVEKHAVPIQSETDEGRFDAQVAALTEAVGRIKSRPAAFALSAPAHCGVVRALTMPFRGKKRVLAAVPFELEPFLAVPIEELVVDAVPIREVEGQTEVFVMGMRQDRLAELLNICSAAGVDPESIGADAAGMTALWLARQRTASGLTALLHVRDDAAYLVVLHNRNFAYLRPLGLTADQVLANPAGAARAVKNAVRAFTAGWKGSEPVERLAVCGIALQEEDVGLFRAELGIDVSAEDLLGDGKAGSKTGEPSAPDAACWASVVGVAAACAGTDPRLEFRKDALRRARPYGGLVSHLVFSASLLVVAAALFGLHTYFSYRANVRQTEAIAQQVWEECAEAFPEAGQQGRPPNDLGGIQSFTLMEEQMKKRERQGAVFSPEMFSGPTLLDLLLEISQALPDSTVGITNIKVTSGLRSEVLIDGEVKDSAAFNSALATLQASKVLKFDPGTDLQRTFREGKETFTIRTAR